MCPPLYARFKNGLVYGFIKGRVSTVEELAQNKSAKWIATKLAKWHKVTLPKTSKKDQKLWSTIYKWLDQVPSSYKDEKIQTLFQTHFDMKQVRAEVI